MRIYRIFRKTNSNILIFRKAILRDMSIINDLDRQTVVLIKAARLVILG